MMGAFGDLLFDLTGQVDPRRKMAQTLAGAGQPPTNAVNLSGSVNPKDAAAGGTPTQLPGGNPNTASAPAPAPQAPPQPQAYTSAPDFSKMYLDLLNRQESSDAIDRGMGMLFAGFAQPQDRASMVSAMSNTGAGRSSPAEMIASMQTAQIQQGKIDARTQLLQNAPLIAKQLNMPVEQVIAAINSGAMDDIIKEHDKATTLQASPLYKAQTASAQGEANLHAAQIEEQNALAKLHAAEIEGVPAKIDQAKAEAEAARARAAQAAAETAAIPGKEALAAAQTEEAKAKATNEPLTPDIKNYNKYVSDFQADPDNAGKKPLSFLDFQRQGGGGGGGVKLYGQTHIQVKTDAQGNTLRNSDGSPQFDVVQLSDRPGVPPVSVPGLQPKITKTDTDTETVYSVVTDQGTQVIDRVPKNVQEGARQKAVGEEEGKAQAGAKTALETKLSTLDDQIKIISDAINDPNLPSRTGPLLTNPWRAAPPATGADIATQSRLDQAMNLNIAAVASTLRDAGISRPALAEVMAAANSVNRLRYTNMSPADYKIAGQEAITRLQRAMAIAYDSAGVNRPDSLKNIKLETAVAPTATVAPTSTGPAPTKVWRKNKTTGKYEQVEQ